MTYYNYFDSVYYQDSYPDVFNAVNTPRGFTSGLQHFATYGLNEGRTLASPYFNEGAYLQLYPDVANAVKSGVYKSGLQHFSEIGFSEGRYSPIGGFDSEQVYLQKYPDVAQAVKNGAYRSGYQHFLEVGLYEGRSPSYLNEGDYLTLNPDVKAAIGKAVPDKNAATGEVIYSGFDHYVLYGQYENRHVLFSGTSGNNSVTAFGKGAGDITGVAYQTLSASPFDYKLLSTGVGEIDTLTGLNEKGDRFLLGTGRSASNANPIALYVGRGNADYALIRNFTKGLDTIQLAGASTDYTQQVSGGNLTISTKTGNDLVAILEGITTPLTFASQNTAAGVFTLA